MIPATSTLPGSWTGLIVQIPHTARVDLTFEQAPAESTQFSGTYVLQGEAEGAFTAYLSGDTLTLELGEDDRFGGKWFVEARVYTDMIVGTVSQAAGGKPVAGLVLFKPERIDVFGAWNGALRSKVPPQQSW